MREIENDGPSPHIILPGQEKSVVKRRMTDELYALYRAYHELLGIPPKEYAALEQWWNRLTALAQEIQVKCWKNEER